MSVAEALGRQDYQQRRTYPVDGLYLGSGHGKKREHNTSDGTDRSPIRDEYNPTFIRQKPTPRDPYNERRPEDFERLYKERMDMEENLQTLREKRMKLEKEKQVEKKEVADMMRYEYPWGKRTKGHGAPRDTNNGGNRRKKFLETELSPRNQAGYKSESDLFLETLGGPGGTVVRENGYPRLTDHHYHGTQQANEMDEQMQIEKHERRMEEMRKQIDNMKNEGAGLDGYTQREDMSYNPGRHSISPRKDNEQRSLDLENSRGGAGAPFKDTYGKTVTRRPITLSVNDHGASRIKEMSTIESLKKSVKELKPYHPWGGAGGGAPVRDRDGNVLTQVYGNFETKTAFLEDQRKKKRGQEVLYNELKIGLQQQKENKEKMDKYMKEPQADLAEMMMQGRVGKPKRNEITGQIDKHHLPQSDIVKTKINYQPKTISEKQLYHDELVKAAEERRNQRMLDNMKENQEAKAHFQNMDMFWGHKGGGAPKDHSIRKKANLTNSLFHPDEIPVGQSPRNRELTINESDVNNHIYSKSSYSSSHKNMFENPTERRAMRAPEITPLPPFATAGRQMY